MNRRLLADRLNQQILSDLTEVCALAVLGLPDAAKAPASKNDLTRLATPFDKEQAADFALGLSLFLDPNSARNVPPATTATTKNPELVGQGTHPILAVFTYLKINAWGSMAGTISRAPTGKPSMLWYMTLVVAKQLALRQAPNAEVYHANKVLDTRIQDARRELVQFTGFPVPQLTEILGKQMQRILYQVANRPRPVGAAGRMRQVALMGPSARYGWK